MAGKARIGRSGSLSRRSRGTFGPIEYMIQTAAGFLFLVMGIAGLAGDPVAYGDLNQTFYRFFSNYYKTLQIILALIELASGIVLIATLFAKVSRKLERGALLAAAVILLIIILLQFVAAPSFGGAGFNWLEWGWMLLLHAIVLIALYGVWRKS